MTLYIHTDTASLEAQRNLASTQRSLAQNFQRLSSGYRTKGAADDAASLGLASS